MNFSEILNNYIKELGCTSKELSDVSGISESLISRYRSGNRLPKYKGKQFESLIKALLTLAKDKNIVLNENTIRSELESNLNKNDIDFDLFLNNFNSLITTLNINVSSMSKYIGFDASFISKIRSGARKPQNTNDFVNSICKYVVSNYYNDTYKETLKDLVNCNEKLFNNKAEFYKCLYFWLTNNKYTTEDYSVNNFLQKLDDFDLNTYIKAIKFDKLITPTIPKLKSKSKTYYGLKGFKDAQLDVLKRIAFSNSKDDVFFYSNMPMVEASKDLAFTKHFMFYLALILKKGITLNMIHNLDRPFKELMLGLEGWIPLYMTGQINPYYFKNNSDSLYSYIECSSSAASLSGKCIKNHINNSILFYTDKKDEIGYYSENAKVLLKNATPLMNIYTKDKKDDFHKLLNNNKSIFFNRTNMLLNLPLYTLSSKLLNKILDENNVSENDKDIIKTYIKDERNAVNNILKNSKILDEITILSEDEFNNSNYNLNLSKIFYDTKEIKYTYEDYKEHIKLTKDFKKKNKNYDYKTNNNNIFKNIEINIINGKQVIISKTNDPYTQFVIYHPGLIDAIENFKAPITEKN